MRVYIIGAGPGDPKLLTLRGAELIARCPVVLYTGSLVPREVVAHARPDSKVLDSSGMTLDGISALMLAARDADQDVARVHTGDPTIFGSTAEQIRQLIEHGIEYEIIPGVSSFTAAAARLLGRELTLPELSQTVILTRAAGRTPMPPGEELEDLARHRSTLVLFLSITLLGRVVRSLVPAYGADCPVAIVHKASWPDQVILTGTLADIEDKVRQARINATAIILVGRVLTSSDFANSRLYDPEFTHRFRVREPGMTIPRLVVAGISSGVGKTTVFVALCRALRARGLKVAPFKAGPDYLDPTYHARAAGAPSHTLDGWMMGREAVLDTFASVAQHADVALIEGVMGLFDGASATSEEGSTAQIAKWLRAPAIVVVDASGMARTLAAVAHGVATFDPELAVSGVLCNRVGSRRHLDILKEAVTATPVLGGLPKEPALAFPERHLGLFTADEESAPEAILDRWGELAEQWIDIDSLLAMARSAPPLEVAAQRCDSRAKTPCRIGFAYDEAFHFYYEDNLRRAPFAPGAELIPFSPLTDSRLPAVDGLYFGGGYPEAHAATLACNLSMKADIAAFAAAKKPVYAECGGLMYLARGIRTPDGQLHEMAGLIPGEVVMHGRMQALGYTEVDTICPTILGPAGLRFRGHQFRYSEFRPDSDSIRRSYRLLSRRAGTELDEGYSAGSVLASYVHAHWASNPAVAEGFAASCALASSGVTQY